MAAPNARRWQFAEDAGDQAPWRMQALLGRTQSDQEKARDICRDYAIERLGDPLACWFSTRLRIPTKPARHSDMKPATDSDLKPARVPI